MRDARFHRLRLFEKADGLCYYCETKTIFPSVDNSTDGSPNLATIDHIYSKFHPDRMKPNSNNEKRHVLSCFKCNQERARLEEILQFLINGIFFLEKKSNKIVQRKRSHLPIAEV